MARDQRRLAAIVSADVVGYSLLMGRDDSATLAGLKAHRQELIDRKIAEYGGRIVKTTGDGLLLEFPSVVDAVRCAVDVQRGMAERNAGVPAEQRIEFRIGINVGDIIIDGDDIFGDGVNVAARLQTLAEPGGICVSKVVRDQVLDKLSFAFEDLGSQPVKNIARPVEAYRVDLGSGAQAAPGRRRWLRLTRPWGWRWTAVGVVALAIAGVIIWVAPQFWKTVPSADSPPPFSIAILPFAAASDSAGDRQFAEDLNNDVTTGLGRLRMARVTPHRVASAYTGKTIDLPGIGRDLNVRYIAEGEIRKEGEKAVVTVQLTDTRSHKQMWSDRLEYEAAALAANPNAPRLQLTYRLRVAMIDTETRRAVGEKASVTPMDLVLRGYAANGAEVGVNGPREARNWFEAALKLDPNFVPALVAAVSSYDDELTYGPNPGHQIFEQKMDALAGRAISIDPDDAMAWGARAIALQWEGRLDEARSASERAESLDPSRQGTLVEHAFIMLLLGRPAETVALSQRAEAIDPPSGGLPQLLMCKGYLFSGRYRDAIATCEKSAGQNLWWVDQVYLIAAYANTGEMGKAKIARDELLRLHPGFAIDEYRKTWYCGTPAFYELAETYLATGLRKVGIRDQ